MAGSGSISSDRFDRALADVAGVLRGQGLRHALFGGLAVVLRGAPRLTTDIDFLVEVPRIRQPALLDEFEKRGADYGRVEETPGGWRARTQRDVLLELADGGLTSFTLGGVRVDFLLPLDPIHRAALDEASELDWEHGSIPVVRVEHLILDKLIAGRGRDLDDVSRLASVHGSRLAREKIDPWLSVIEQSGGIPEAQARELLGG